MRSGSRDGEMIGPSAQDRARVSRFRARDNEKVMPTNATSGPLFSTSSPSASLQRSLENRLRARMDVNGSPEYVLTWREWDMPSGPPICALRASGRRTLGSDFGGWPTPDASAMNLIDANWQERREACKARHGNNGFGLTLGMAVTLVGWPTPMSGSPGTEDYNPAGNTDSSRKTVALAGWPTPNVPNGGRSIAHAQMKGGTAYHNGKKVQVGLEAIALLAGWPAQTEKRGALNPAFSLWLMGFPPEWESCAPPAMPSFRKSRRSSS